MTGLELFGVVTEAEQVIAEAPFCVETERLARILIRAPVGIADERLRLIPATDVGRRAGIGTAVECPRALRARQAFRRLVALDVVQPADGG